MLHKNKLVNFLNVGALMLMTPLIAQYFGNAWVRIIDIALLYVLLALGLNIVVGYAGLLDLGLSLVAIALLAQPVHLDGEPPALGGEAGVLDLEPVRPLDVGMAGIEELAVHLVGGEDPRERLADGVEVGAHLGRQGLGCLGLADSPADEIDVGEHGRHVGGIDDEDGIAQLAHAFDVCCRREVVAAGQHEVGLKVDELLHDDAAERGHVGQGDGLWRMVVEVRATHESVARAECEDE